MTSPMVHTFPVKRPGFIAQAIWIGDDDDLSLQLSYTDLGDVTKSLQLDTQNAGRVGELCLPTNNDVAALAADVGRIRDILAAHVRMAVMIKGQAVPGSKEFTDAILDQAGANNLQTALGTVKVKTVTLISDKLIDLEFQKGTGPKRTYQFDHQELSNYTFVPSTQLLVVSGAIEKKYPSYVHDHPNTVLTASQKQNIIDYVFTLEPWV